MSAGAQSHRGYAVRAGDVLWAFVPHPETSGWWLRCHPAVLIEACETCGAKRGQPCKGKTGYSSYTHRTRRIAAKKRTRRLDYAFAIVTDVLRP